jgi:catechol 2,3-dioxygenase-like lactoylglutathione lyase family enzyme
MPSLRSLAPVLLAALLALAPAVRSRADDRAAPAPAPSAQAPLATRVGPISLTVADLDSSVRFYTGVLGFTELAREERSGDAAERLYGVFGARARSATLRLGDEQIELIEFLTPPGRPVPPDTRSNDRWFQHIAIAVGDMARAYERLEAAHVRHASTSPQRLPDWNPAAGGIEAFYFKDPDEHVLEIIHFPDGKGDPRWHAPEASGRLFLGIDHTAIVVADTDRSLAFYGGVLGFRVAGGSMNHGVEQEHLNNVFGARLRITTLRAPEGPGVELLEYLSPSDGRDAPRDARPTDLWHWHVAIATRASINDAERALIAARARLISAAPAGERRDGSAVMARDPDGHAVMLTSEPAPRAAAAPTPSLSPTREP